MGRLTERPTQRVRLQVVELLFYPALTSRPNCLISPKSAFLIVGTFLRFPKLLNSGELGVEVSFIGAPELDGNCAHRRGHY